MEPHPLTTFTPRLVAEHGSPQVLDVEHSIQAHKPTLTGASSYSSYYIRPPDGMSAEALIEWFESVPGFPSFNLTLVSTLGVDTYHQPIISSDEFAKKYFHDNHLRIVRVVGKSDPAIDAMHAFIEALKPPFDAAHFPHHEDFSVSSYRAPENGRAAELKLLFKPAYLNLLLKAERTLAIHFSEANLGREIRISRHYTRNQPPELIFSSTGAASAGVRYLDSLTKSLPQATPQEIAAATDLAQKTAGQAGTDAGTAAARFYQPQAVTISLSPTELKRKVIANLVEIIKGNHIADGVEINVVQAGTAIEMKFPRTLSSLFMATSYNEAKQSREMVSACIGVRTDPTLREGWSAHYNFDRQSGKLLVRAVETGADAPTGWKQVPTVD